MDQVIGEVLFVDGVTRPVYQQRDGRQYVLGEGRQPVYGVWILLEEDEPLPTVVLRK
jgi:hypothetical protein